MPPNDGEENKWNQLISLSPPDHNLYLCSRNDCLGFSQVALTTTSAGTCYLRLSIRPPVVIEYGVFPKLGGGPLGKILQL